MSNVPSKSTPLIDLGVLNLVAVLAFPDKEAPINWLAVTILNVLVPVVAVTLPCTFPIKSAETVPAEKSPALSLATIVPIVLLEVASTLHVTLDDPLKLLPTM